MGRLLLLSWLLHETLSLLQQLLLFLLLSLLQPRRLLLSLLLQQLLSLELRCLRQGWLLRLPLLL